MGIEQLVEMYKGNPGPLDAKVKQAQQGQQPGELPQDLEEAIALQKIAELQTGAKNQQAMQAGGAQPSIVEKLKQMLAANQRQQAQPPAMPQGMPPQQGQPQMAQAPMPQGPQGGPPQGQPVMAAHGGSIAHLVSNLGRHYAGGGIIAFNGEEDSDVKDPEDKRSLIERLLYSNITPAEQQRREALQTTAEGRRVAPVDGSPQQASSSPKENWGSMLEKLLYSNITPEEQRRREALQAAANERAGISAPVPPTTLSNRAALNNADAASRSQPGASNRALLNEADAASRSQPAGNAATAASGAPRPSAGIAGGGGRPAAEAMDPMEAAIRASIMKEMGRNEDEEWKKGAGRYEQFMGLDKLLQPREARIAERQEMMKKIQGERTPAWVEALSAAGRPVRGGIGTLLNQMGNAAESTRKGYSAEDLKFVDQINDMKDEVDKLKLDGKYKAAAAGEAAIKDLIANKRQAEQSGTSLLNKQAQIEATKQLARDAAASRAQSAKQHSDNQALALEERKRQFDEKQLQRIREQDVARAAKIDAAIAKRVGMIDIELQSSKLKPEQEADLLRRRNEIVKQVQAEYPPIKPEKPSESQFMAAARAANPGVSDAELKAYYKQNYGS